MKKYPSSYQFLLGVGALLIIVCLLGFELGKLSGSKELKVSSQPSNIKETVMPYSVTMNGDSVEYQNMMYGFSFKYPAKFRLSTDENWPYAIALLTEKGSTAYQLSVEVATSKEDLNKLVVRPSEVSKGYGVLRENGTTYVVIGNADKNPEIDKIISTFKFTR